MVIARGDVWWAELGGADGSAPAFRRPVLVVSSDSFNRSRIATVTVVAITSNTALADAPGNVEMEPGAAGLRKRSVANVSQVITLDKRQLAKRSGAVPLALLQRVDDGLRLALDLAV